MTSLGTIIKRLLNVKDIIVESIKVEEKQGLKSLHIHLKPSKRYRFRCSCCQRVCPIYDGESGKEPGVWRSLDWGGLQVFLHFPTCRVNCPEHGVKVSYVPWAFAHSHFTRAFDLLAAWLATTGSKSTVSELMRIDWKTVGRCINRARCFLEPDPSKRFDHLSKIGIDETSYQSGHKYLTVVVNHNDGSVVWAHEGHDTQTLSLFFEQLTEEQRQSIKVVSGDGARWIDACIKKYIPHASRCMDRFHVVQWANEALDEVRRHLWRQASHQLKQLIDGYKKTKGKKNLTDKQKLELQKQTQEVSRLKGGKFALGKDPNNLTSRQETYLKAVETCSPRLFRAYSLKETLRLALKATSVEQADELIDSWRNMAWRSKIPQMVELNRKIKRHKSNILNAIHCRLSNGRVEAINNKIQLIIRKSFGFKNEQSLINMILLVCSSLKIPLPNRTCDPSIAHIQFESI